jgi:hypothetical protein
MAKSLWIVTGMTESGDEWVLQFSGERPTYERINYVYADEYPEEWDYMPEAGVSLIEEVGSDGSYPSDGPELECGTARPGGPEVS